MAGLGSGVNYIPNSTAIQSPIGNNSTDVPLGASATYTGPWEQNPFPDVMISAQTDVFGQLFVEYSDDGVNPITNPSLGFSVGSGVHEFHVLSKGPRYFRVRFANGAVAQTYLRLYTYYGDFKRELAALNERVGRDNDSNLSRPTDFGDEVIRGLRSGVTYNGKFGYKDGATAAAGEQTLWAESTDLVIMTTADTFTITYDAATDGAGGGATGATTLLITYLDANFEEQDAIVVLGSTGSDVTGFTGLGINRVAVIASGSSNSNVNDLSVAATGSGDVQALVPAGDSVTQQLVYHCPINVIPIINYIRITSNRLGGGSAPKVDFNLRVFNRFTETVYRIRRYTIDTDSTNIVKEETRIALSGRDVVYFTMDTDTNNTSAQGTFSLRQYAVD